MPETATYRFLLRMPEELRARLAASAAQSRRSLNAEVVHRLARSLDAEPRFSSARRRTTGGA